MFDEHSKNDLSVKDYVTKLFEYGKYEQLRVIDEVLNSTDKRGVRGVYEINEEQKRPRKFEPYPGIIEEHENYIAISPAVIDELSDVINSEKEKRTADLRNAVSKKIEELQQKKPGVEVDHVDERMLKIKSQDDMPLYIYISTWLIRSDFKKTFDDDSHLVISVTHQPVHSIVNFVDENQSLFDSLLAISFYESDYPETKSFIRVLRGYKHPLLNEIFVGSAYSYFNRISMW
ncbi:hypothetical protein DRN98_06945 [Methanosarcinales archaeon]|nr:MAG: hypothetical protein DRN98_06945 [Methanosarcinales archaeon]